ncbi:hypothetical protein HN51_054982 [Arachis hypogaea]|uniref:NTF2-like domain-containing protein n=1 Tax=Arachis hypogaea TaxID=3818 RepID=A0A444XM47_ARAHY|nr:uncharacterized protein LOC107619122 isoform X1 [Arachis ipaensis]XP_025677099.1 uncharacterized protein LOC112777034 isoform X1 [Arachis hypogaea]QHN77623.1 uncharacterized protein DS421_19g654310 [Arachis hypogaea]RYQ90790.1 hypothetical protein Ahy_B09g096783 isoform A [Arachis hypogaea]
MAQTIFHFIGTPPLLPPSNSKLQLRRNHVFQCQCFSNTSSNSNSNGSAPNSRRKSSNSETETPPLLKAAVSAVTELLRLLSPSNQASSLSEDTEEFRDEFPLSSVDDVLNIIQSDYDKAYFVTGNFTNSIYAENCIFEDPTIKFRGRELYARNLKLLVPFFDCASIRLQKIEKDVDSETNFVLATWKLRTNLNLPWRPLISIDGSTYYELDKDFKIVRHVESWNVSALEAILQIFTFTSEITGV